MPSDIRAIKKRMKSIENTLHITNAMKLVASSKIRRALNAHMSASDYAGAFRAAYSSLITRDSQGSVFLKERSELPSCYIIVAADRGLAGGYNGNIFRLSQTLVGKNDTVIPIGKRAVDYCRRKYGSILTDEFSSSEKISDSEMTSLSALITEGYKRGEYGAIYIISTKLVSVLTQDASSERILPLSLPEKSSALSAIFEPDPVTVMNYAIKSYVTAIICSAVRESFICELYSRRNAMDSASENAENIINDLNLAFNRARQSSITQEITEIVAGAEER